MKRRDLQKGMILFVHGFGSSHECWKTMLKLLSEDNRINARYGFATWDYPTKWVELNLLGRIPRLEEIGRSLADEIDSPKYRGCELTLVGHSQGGLVIQNYFAELLNGQASKLRDVRQAIFFATPNEGSTTAISLRHFMSTFFRNPQEVALRVLNPDVSDMRAIIRERIVAATEDNENNWRVPIHAFCGMQDNIVPETSARGPFDRVKRVKGTHFSIIKPEDDEDPRYTEFVELLLDPGGHTHRFEIESYETIISVEPREKDTIHTTSEKNPRTVEFDSYCTIKRTVRFSANNHCKEHFTIRYSTRNDGYIVGHTSHANKVPSAEKGLWEDTGTSFQFDFTPEYGQEFCLNVEVYKGFDDKDARNVHFHLGNHSHYRRIKYVLDLSAYVAAGYNVLGPSFYLHPEDHEHGDLCGMRGAREALEMVSQTPEGVYHWELQGVQQGIVDIFWDVSKSATHTKTGENANGCTDDPAE